MPTMRHPKVDGSIEAPESALTVYRMSGWVTEEENPDLFPPEPEPEETGDSAEGQGGEENAEDAPDASGEDKTKAPRRPRASSKESE